jgi:hypothetical protein
MGIIDIFKGKEVKTYSEKLEENEELDIDLSIAEKKYYLKQLEEKGLNKSDFGNSWKKIVAWLRTH